VSIPPRPRVLIADDQRLIADMLVLILNQNRFETAAVYGGRQAVEKARQWRPDLFLSDVSMPEINGIQAANEIHAILPECRILLFSGDPGSADLIRQARSGGQSFEFLEKPIPPASLLKRIRSLHAAA
jgi:CheY-like chemotaxis protein